jgi:hypothetical protein
MAKSTKPSGVSRIKLIVLEAEVADDQLHTLTQAFTNALRGPAAPVKRLATTSATNGHAEPEAEVLDDAEDELETVDVTPKPRSTTVRKAAPTPEVLPIDFNAYDVTLGNFVAGYKTESHLSRYLVAAAWFHEHGGVAKVTPAHIYSAYRWLKWPLTVKDFAQPLRDLKAQQLFTSSEKGTYTLHHVGLQRVTELKTGATGNAA